MESSASSGLKLLFAVSAVVFLLVCAHLSDYRLLGPAQKRPAPATYQAKEELSLTPFVAKLSSEPVHLTTGKTPSRASSIQSSHLVKSLDSKYQKMYAQCGDLCNFDKPIEPGTLFGSVRAKVQCRSLFSIEEPEPNKAAVRWGQIPKELKSMFTHNGSVKVRQLYFNDDIIEANKNKPIVFSREQINFLVSKAHAGNPDNAHNEGHKHVMRAASEGAKVAGQNILVIGSVVPWVEAILLAWNASMITTLGHGSYQSEHPQLKFIKPKEFALKFLTISGVILFQFINNLEHQFNELTRKGQLEQFDSVYTYSSVEHFGLGRFGETINPWGDVISVAKAWCATKDGGKLAISVPTNHQQDWIVFNTHRIYGPILYPFLVTNWKFVWAYTGTDKTSRTNDIKVSQPTYVFEKVLDK